MRAAICLLLTVVALTQGHVRQEVLAPQRCLPGQNCFPNRLELKEFAATLSTSARLVQPFDAEYSSLVRNNNNRVTRHPAMVLLAGEVADVQKGMLFARKWQLMVTSQSSSDETTGRSTFDGSLNINLSQLNRIFATVLLTDRNPDGEITCQPGNTWAEMYDRARLYDKVVVAPNTYRSTVGETLGDGGVGPLVRIYGLVSDNVLEIQVVMADGSLVTVTEYAVEQDFGNGLTRKFYDRKLFAALSGGGIGPFGIPVGYTFRMREEPAEVTRVRLQYNLYQDGNYIGQPILEALMGSLEAIPQKWVGSIYVSGLTSTTTPNTKGGLVLNLAYFGPTSDADYSFIDSIRSIPDPDGALVSDTVVTTDNTPGSVNNQHFQQFAAAQPTIISAQQSSSLRYYGFSTLLQTPETPMADAATKLSQALLFALNAPTVDSNYFCTGTLMGFNASDAPYLVDLVNPALRKSYMTLSCQLAFPGRGIDDSYFVQHSMDFLKLLEPFGEGSKSRYWAGEDVVGWKQAFHGHTYGDLIETKLRYDVDNYLWCHNCVGSDFRVEGCSANEHHRDTTGFLNYGNQLGGYISGQRYRTTKAMGEMERAQHKARLVYIHQMHEF